ncbi:MAG: hypothetical protein U1E84_16655 [Rhodoferax sp.]
MTKYHAALAVDFGEVGYRNGRHPFRIRLDTEPLADLIRATDDAHRVYELLLIDRPGDVWDYVWVILDEVPTRVADQVEHARQDARPRREDWPHPWPDDRIPFKVFDRFFYWMGDDTSPEDEAWLNHRDSALMQSFAQQALSIARAAQSRLVWNDHLLRHVVSRIRSGEHPYCYLDRAVARERSRGLPPKEAKHTPAFYQKLSELLRDSDLASVAYRANGDYRVLRMMATEQRRRANLTGHEAGVAMHLSALVNRKIDNEAWESRIWFFEEGLAHGDLFIEGGGLGGNSIRSLVEENYRDPGRFIFSIRDEGEIKGFTKETGDGWVLYRKLNPITRRMALDCIEHSRGSKLGAVLSFTDRGATIFDYDKSVVLIGEDVPAAARGALASVVAEWQQVGGDPLLVVIGDTAPFDLAGCQGMVTVPADASDEKSLARWLLAALRQSRPWIDVVMALRAPDWAKQVLAERSQHQHGPWPTWVAATESESPLKADQLLDGDLTQRLIEAHQRAKSTRPRIL